MERKKPSKGAEVIRYSESFKLQVVGEIEAGVHADYASARRAYGIGATGTVSNWHRRYGNTYKKRRLIRVESMADKEKMKRLEERVRQLEQALSDTTIDLLLERQYVKLACRQAGIEDVSGFKKKAGGPVSTGSLAKPDPEG